MTFVQAAFLHLLRKINGVWRYAQNEWENVNFLTKYAIDEGIMKNIDE